MKKISMAVLAILVFLSGCYSSKKIDGDKQLSYKPVLVSLLDEITHMDSVLFNAFNDRDIETFQTLFTNDLEFYHDKDGLTGYTHTIESLRSTTEANSDLTRELMPGTLEVYPIGKYGAVQTGMHRFCHTEDGKKDCGSFKFVHIWKKEDGGWKISRVISYDH